MYSEEKGDGELVRYVKVVPNFMSFCIDKVNAIYDHWASGDVEKALKMACEFVFFLPRPLKKQLKPEVEKIQKELSKAYEIQSIDFYMTNTIRNRTARQIALRRIEPFVDMLVDELDKRHYLEQGPLAPKYPSRKPLVWQK